MEIYEIYKEFERLINYGLKKNLFEEDDKTYIRNSLIELFGIEEYIVEEVENEELENPTSILDNLLNYAFKMGILESNSPVYRDLLDTKIMNLFMPRPSEVIREFNRLYNEEKICATNYLYNLSKACDYVRTSRIAQNVTWKTNTEYGDIDITINLSKPEKDPKAIAATRNMKSSSYPKCLLCKENVGYAGRLNHPARQNLRVVPFKLDGEVWNFQYSPYSYYNEHCIIFSSEHIPMVINKNTFDRNLEFVDKFPHYFIGSNADLPIVGGSILTHDHYQGGRYEFAMERAKDVYRFEIERYEDIRISIIKWPLTVVRISGESRHRLSKLAEQILLHWRAYSDMEVGVHAFTDATPHNTVTPIARRRGKNFELDLVLRNNRTSEEYPDGIYHPHKELHHIKKENIGLIEVLGLAVLPARLKDEIAKIKEYLLNKEDNRLIKEDENLKVHLEWFKTLKNKYPNISEGDVDNILETEIGNIFTEVLEHCGVFKWNEKGIAAINRYMDNLSDYIQKQ